MKKCYRKIPSNREIYLKWKNTNEWYSRGIRPQILDKARHNTIIDIIKKYFTSGNIFDIGSASQPFIDNNIYFRYDNYIEIDFLNFEGIKDFDISHIKSSFNYIPIRKDRIFDLIIWADGPEHARNPSRVIMELNEMCREYIILTCPNNERCGNNKEHYWCINKEDMRNLLQYFNVIEVIISGNTLIGVGKVK